MKKKLLLLLLAVCPLSRLDAQTTYEEWVAHGLEAARGDSLREAEQAFKQALKLSPADYRNVLLFTNLGRVQETLYWQRLHEEDLAKTDPGTGDKTAAQDRRTSRQLADEAIENYTRALNFSPDGVPILAARAQMFLRMRLWDRAISDLSHIVDLRPDNVVARNYRAYAYAQQRRYDEAHVDYERVLAKIPDNYEAWLGLAIVEQRMGHLDKAIELVSRLMESCPDSTQLYSVRASAYAENHQPELALMDLDHAVAADTLNTDYLLARAYLHLEQGDRLRARRDFVRAVSLGVPAAAVRKEMEECR